MNALDLCCCAGGASQGLADAGLDDIVGVDIKAQPNYPFHFIQADALEYLKTADLSWFSLIWASPPCQRFTALRHAPGTKEHADLITPIRALLERTGKPYCIENVPGAPLRNPCTLCGTMFNLRAPDGAQVIRHRLFEVSGFRLTAAAPCRHQGPVIGVYGAHLRDRRRPAGTNHKSGSNRPREHGFIAMGIAVGSMTLAELSEAIPPAYARYVAEAFLAQCGKSVSARPETVMERIQAETRRRIESPALCSVGCDDVAMARLS
jgi:DNA (cytosine-5)-methyltransferase 1